MIYDGFIFFNELDLLELRLKTLYDYVDCFIIVEAKKTFTNQDKELNFENNRTRFEKYLDKIEYIEIDEFPSSYTSAWEREHYQRSMIEEGYKNANDDDIVIVSDLDEIESPYALKRAKSILKKHPERIIKFEMLNCWYYLNYVDQKSFFWAGSTAYTVSEAKRYHSECKGSYPLDENGGLTPQTARSWNDYTTVPCAGWHFSYMGGVESIKKKIRAFSHQEYNSDEWLDDNRVIEMIESGKDLFDRGISDFVSIPIDTLLPRPILINSAYYKPWICDFKRISRKKYFRLKIKYLCETTYLWHIYRVLRETKKYLIKSS